MRACCAPFPLEPGNSYCATTVASDIIRVAIGLNLNYLSYVNIALCSINITDFGREMRALNESISYCSMGDIDYQTNVCKFIKNEYLNRAKR